MLRTSFSRSIDGLWIGCFRNENRERVLSRVATSLQLIKLHDPIRYNHLTRDLERIWVNLVPGYRAQYRSEFRMCELDERFVLAEATTPETIASVIVHEATHARLQGCGIGYGERIRARVEAICIRRQVAFTERLPDGMHAHEEAVRNLAPQPPEFWANAAFLDRRKAGSAEVLRYLGVPNYIVRMTVVMLTLIWGINRMARDLLRAQWIRKSR
jgi:hypothetical protein